MPLPRILSGPYFLNHMSCDMTKATKWMCTQRRLRSARASAQSDQSSLSAWRNLGSLATHWAHSEDWSDWTDDLADFSLCWVHMPFCWFCHEAAHMQFIHETSRMGLFYQDDVLWTRKASLAVLVFEISPLAKNLCLNHMKLDWWLLHVTENAYIVDERICFKLSQKFTKAWGTEEHPPGVFLSCPIKLKFWPRQNKSLSLSQFNTQ